MSDAHIVLLVVNSMLATDQRDIVDALQKKYAKDDPLLMCGIGDGRRFINWPNYNAKDLAEALFDQREQGLCPDLKHALLPDGRLFAIDQAVASAVWKGVYPGMCIDPNICRGKSHCPRSYSCCE